MAKDLSFILMLFFKSIISFILYCKKDTKFQNKKGENVHVKFQIQLELTYAHVEFAIQLTYSILVEVVIQ